MADAYFSSVVGLWWGTEPNGSTTLDDQSTKGYDLTAAGGATTQGGYIDLPGAGGDYFGRAQTDDFAFGTGDFTIEWRSIKTSNGAGGYDLVAVATTNGSGTDGFFIELSTSRGMYVYSNSSQLLSISNATLGGGATDGVDHHWAITRSGSTVRGFKDGVLLGTGTSSVNMTAAGTFGIGGSSQYTSQPFKGKIRDFRITKGVARYTADFTPPSSPLELGATPTTVTPSGFAPVAFGAPSTPLPVTGLSPVAFGTPAVPVPQVATASGFAPATFGSPAIHQAVTASGFSPVVFGTATVPNLAKGFSPVTFGTVTALAPMLVTGFAPVAFGQPRLPPQLVTVTSLRATRFGTPYLDGVARTAQPRGFVARTVGYPAAIRMIPHRNIRLGNVLGVRAATFGTPTT